MDTEVQPTAPHENGSQIEQISPEPENGESVSNGKDSNSSPKHLAIRETRNRSRTPQKKSSKKSDDDTNSIVPKPDDNINGHQTRSKRSSDPNHKQELNQTVEEVEPSSKVENVSGETGKDSSLNQDDQTVIIEEVQVETETLVIESEVTVENTIPCKTVDRIEMDPLILAFDEQDPELQFDENSDMDSVKSSPTHSRCKTRRSHTRNVPSPKTPKSATDSESEKISTAPTSTPENLTDTFDEDVSTKAEIGSDTTRLEFMENNTSIQSEESQYVPNYNEKSYRESIGRLSGRRTIRPLNDSYRQRALRNSQNKTDLNATYSKYESVDGLQLGVKRKRSSTPEDRKKFKEESSSFVSYLSTPLSNFKRRFSADFGSSSPKLTGYKDSTNDIHEDDLHQEVDSEDFEKKNKCSVM